MKIGIIGCGNMGRSMAKRLLSSHHLSVYDHYPPMSFLKEYPEIRSCQDPQEVTANSELIFLIVKPKDLQRSAEQLKPHLKSQHILISVLAGVSLSQLNQVFGDKQLILRMMPNLAVEYGQGVMGLAEHPSLPTDVKEQITQLLSPLGLVIWLPEEKMDAISSLAGSGPAFILMMIEAMVDAGIIMGFTSGEAMKIVMQTMQGALQMLEHTKKHPGELRWQVSSPAGMTIAGTQVMESEGVRSGIMNTFIAAYQRAKELSPLK